MLCFVYNRSDNSCEMTRRAKRHAMDTALYISFFLKHNLEHRRRKKREEEKS